MKINEFQKRLISSTILIPLSLICIYEGSVLFNFFLILCLVVSIFEWKKISNKKNIFILGFLFLIFSFFTAYLIRNSFESNGLFIFLFLIIICISSDLGGYIFGKILKGPKLTKISPNKTYSGVLGSFFLSGILTTYFVYYIEHLKITMLELNLNLLIIIFFFSFISQAGDLIVSYFKRKANLEDTGNLIPGHGGILDRIDGIIFVIPTFYFLNFYNYLL
tara:strand:+ start:540 stop:1199 length:660 start_codon:yes stop_codon:yes gene_type:complete